MTADPAEKPKYEPRIGDVVGVKRRVKDWAWRTGRIWAVTPPSVHVDVIGRIDRTGGALGWANIADITLKRRAK